MDCLFIHFLIWEVHLSSPREKTALLLGIRSSNSSTEKRCVIWNRSEIKCLHFILFNLKKIIFEFLFTNSPLSLLSLLYVQPFSLLATFLQHRIYLGLVHLQNRPKNPILALVVYCKVLCLKETFFNYQVGFVSDFFFTSFNFCFHLCISHFLPHPRYQNSTGIFE